MKYFSKRLSISLLSALTIVWSLGLTAIVPTGVHAAAAGSLVKRADMSAVYYVGSNGMRYTFPNDRIYHSWYSDFSGVQTISADELAGMQLAGNVNYRAGTRLVKITTDPRVYAVTPHGVLRAIPSEAVAAAIYGSNWSQWIDDLNDAFFTNYSIGTPIASATDLPSGLLVKDSANAVYLVDGTMKRPIASMSAMDANHYWSMYVRPLADATLAMFSNGTSITGADSSLMDVSQGGSVVVVPTGSGVTVTLASDTPAASTIPDGTIYNPLLKFNVTASNDGDAQLTGVTITRGGFIANTSVSGVSVWDQNGIRHGSILTSLTSDGMGTVSFTGEPIVIPSGQTRSVTVAANISASAGSGTVNFSLSSAAGLTFTNTPAVNGSFPVIGNTMSVVDGLASVGAVTVDGQTTVGLSSEPSSSTGGNLEVGNSQMEVAKFNFSETSSREDVSIRQLVIYVQGDINETTDLANFTVYGPDGVALGSAPRATNRFVTVNLTSPYTVPQGQNRNLTVKADITGGANRWFRLQLQNDYDVLVRGATTGANLLPTDSDGGTWAAEISPSGYFKIKQGQLTITKNSASPSGNLTVGSSNVELGRFDLTANGENLEVRKLAIAIVATNANDHGLSGNLMIQDAATGVSYFTGTASTSAGASSDIFNEGTSASYSTQTDLSGYINLTVGQVKTLKIIGNIRSTATVSRSLQVGLGNAYVRRVNSSDYVNVPDGTGTLGNSLSVGSSGSLTAATHTTPPSPNTVAPGAQNATFATFVVGNQNSGSEPVRVNSINVGLAGTGAAHNFPTELTNLKLWDITSGTPVQLGTTLSSVATSSNSFSLNWTIAANTTRILAVSADFSSSITSGYTVYATLGANSIVGTGQTSNNTVQGPATAIGGQINSMVSAAVRVYFEQDPAVASKVVIAGSQNVEVGRWRFEVTGEDVTLNKLTLRASTTASISNASVANASGTEVFGAFNLYSGSTLLATAFMSNKDADITNTAAAYQNDGASSSARIIFNLATPLTLPRGVGGVLSVKTNIANSGSGASTSLASFLLHSNDSSFLELRSASQGLLSSSSIQTTSTSSVNTESRKYLYIDVAPQVVTLAPVAGVIGTADEIARFELRNYGQVPIVLQTLGFTITGSSLTRNTGNTATDTVTDFKLYDEIGAQIANPVSGYWTALCGGATGTAAGVGQCAGQSPTLSTSTLFSSSNQIGTGWDDNKTIPAASGGSYGRKVFSLRANTLSIAASAVSGQRSLTTQATGTQGFSGSDVASTTSNGTRYWNSTGVTFKFRPMEYSNDSNVQDVYIADTYPVITTPRTYAN